MECDNETSIMVSRDAVAAVGVSCCTLVQANVYILLRLLKEVHFAVIILVFGVVGTALSAAALFAFSSPRIPESSTDIVMTFAVGFLSFLAQIALTQARTFSAPIILAIFSLYANEKLGCHVKIGVLK